MLLYSTVCGLDLSHAHTTSIHVLNPSEVNHFLTSFAKPIVVMIYKSDKYFLNKDKILAAIIVLYATWKDLKKVPRQHESFVQDLEDSFG